jgi:hypothetical protein
MKLRDSCPELRKARIKLRIEKMEHRDSRPELRKGKPGELRVEHLEVQRVHPMVRLVEMPHQEVQQLGFHPTKRFYSPSYQHNR